MKVINILKTFSKTEMNDFSKFVQSPYHNRGKNPAPLFEELKKLYPAFETGELTPEKLHEQVFPGRKFNRQIMWNMSSALEKLALKFLEQESLKKHDFQRNELLTFELGERKLAANYENVLGKMEKIIEDTGIDFYYFEYNGRLEDCRIEYYQMLDKRHLLPELTLRSIEYQMLLSLRMIVGGLGDMDGYTKNFNHKYETNVPHEYIRNLDLKKIVKYAYENKFKYAFVFDIYYRGLVTLLEPENDDNFYTLRELYEKHFESFSMRDKRNIVIWILNYCEYRSLAEPEKYYSLIFDMNEFRLKKGLAYYPKGQIPKLLFLRIINVALLLGKNKWARKFLKDYSSKLHPELIAPVNAMANAFILFDEGSYDEVLEQLKDFELFDTRDKLSARALIAKTYFELNENELLLSYIDSSRHYLKSKNVSERFRLPFSYFLNSLQKLMNLREEPDSFDINRLFAEMRSSGGTVERNWLMTKLKMLGAEEITI
ncbi:MAG: hypothetical protein HOP31_11035 [Ignavibacteria bacterium]|nr:hypothetical protein [Ignavibacteria bacterium]